MTDVFAGEEQGRLADNIAYFARALRAAGLPVGPGAVLDAIVAVEAARIGPREDFYWVLHAVFVKRHEHSILFDQAFRIFWRRRSLIEKLIAQMSPIAPGGAKEEKKPRAGALRVAGALATPRQEKPEPVEWGAHARISHKGKLTAERPFGLGGGDDYRRGAGFVHPRGRGDDPPRPRPAILR